MSAHVGAPLSIKEIATTMTEASTSTNLAAAAFVRSERVTKERDKIMNGIRHLLLTRWFANGRNLDDLISAARIQPEHGRALVAGAKEVGEIDLASLCRIADCLCVDLFTLFTGGDSVAPFASPRRFGETAAATAC